MPKQKGDLFGASFSQIDRRKTSDLLILTDINDKNANSSEERRR